MPTNVTTWAELNTACQSPPADGVIMVMNDIVANNTITINKTTPIQIIGSNTSSPWTLSYPSTTTATTRHFIINGAGGVTFDDIIIDGGSGATNNSGVVPESVTTGGSGITFTNGLGNVIGPNCTIQNCFTRGSITGSPGLMGALSIYAVNGPTQIDFYGTVQYNRCYGTSYYSSGGGVCCFQRNANSYVIFNMFEGSKIQYNSSWSAGGGVMVDTYSLQTNTNNVFNMYGGSINNNVSQSVGGGIAAGASTDDAPVLNLMAGSINDNQATGTSGYSTGVELGNGGGIWLQGGTCNVENDVKIWNNIAKKWGGGAYTSGQTTNNALKPVINVTGGDWKGNQAVLGAAIYKNGGPLVVTGGIFHEHHSAGDGAVFYAQAADITLNASALSTNLKPNDNSEPETGTVSIFNNSSQGNGGVVLVSGTNPSGGPVSSSLVATNILFYNNSAIGNGGVVCSTKGSSTNNNAIATTNFTGCYFDNNSAANGGVLYSNGLNTTNSLTNCKFIENSATNGGAYYIAM